MIGRNANESSISMAWLPRNVHALLTHEQILLEVIN